MVYLRDAQYIVQYIVLFNIILLIVSQKNIVLLFIEKNTDNVL